MAVNVRELSRYGVGMVDLSEAKYNIARNVRIHMHNDNVRDAIVAVEDKECYQSHVSDNLTSNSIQDWIDSLPSRHTYTEDSIQRKIDAAYDQMIHRVRSAAMPESTESNPKKGPNKRAFWNSMITETQRERELVNSMRKHYGR